MFGSCLNISFTCLTLWGLRAVTILSNRKQCAAKKSEQTTDLAHK